MLQGLPQGCKKGTCLVFTTGDSLAVEIDGKGCGSVGDAGLAAAFAGIGCLKNSPPSEPHYASIFAHPLQYTDAKAVCKLKPVD